MTPECVRVVERLGKGVLPRELSEHARTCDACSAALASFSMLQPEPVAPPTRTALAAARADVLRELAKKPVSAPWWREAVWITLISLLFAVGGVIYTGKGWKVFNRSGPDALWIVSILLIFAASWSAFAASIPRGRLHRAGVTMFALELALAIPLAGSGLDVPLPFLKVGLGCLVSEVTISIGPLGATLWLLTRSAFSAWRAFMAGLSAGIAGVLALHLHCPCGTFQHLLLFHVAPWFALAALAVVIRSRLPSRTFAP